ncbi:MAG: hypothetical protein KGJ32_01405 [Xanthomonadaceae bacterium]|nr:hypothetical protein [Xanthomonadaceae bacterium]
MNVQRCSGEAGTHRVRLHRFSRIRPLGIGAIPATVVIAQPAVRFFTRREKFFTAAMPMTSACGCMRENAAMPSICDDACRVPPAREHTRRCAQIAHVVQMQERRSQVNILKFNVLRGWHGF